MLCRAALFAHSNTRTQTADINKPQAPLTGQEPVIEGGGLTQDLLPQNPREQGRVWQKSSWDAASPGEGMAVKQPLQTVQPKAKLTPETRRLGAVAEAGHTLRHLCPLPSSDPLSIPGMECSTFGFGAQGRAGASAQAPGVQYHLP